MKKRIQIAMIKYGVIVEVKVSLVDEKNYQIGTMITLDIFEKLNGKYSISDYKFRDLTAVKSDGLTIEQIKEVKNKIAEMASGLKIGNKDIQFVEFL